MTHSNGVPSLRYACDAFQSLLLHRSRHCNSASLLSNHVKILHFHLEPGTLSSKSNLINGKDKRRTCSLNLIKLHVIPVFGNYRNILMNFRHMSVDLNLWHLFLKHFTCDDTSFRLNETSSRRLVYSSPTQDMSLADLPECVLHHLFSLMCCPIIPSLTENAEGVRKWRTTPRYKSLRCCCKHFRHLLDSFRPSIFFHAQNQSAALAYVCKLPHLNKVSIMYGKEASNISSSLASLFSVAPNLTSLALEYVSQPAVPSIWPWPFSLWKTLLARTETNINPQTYVGRGFRYQAGLQCLVLKDLDFEGGKTSGPGLQFLSDIPSLTSLELHYVSPALSASDIVANTSLQKLTLCHNSTVTDLDLSAVISLTHLVIMRYAVVRLNVCGLTKLKYLNCAMNTISALNVSTCSALTHLDCSYNRITCLDSAQVSGLQKLTCNRNPINQLDVSKCLLLEQLSCEGCAFSDLGLAACTALTSINLAGCKAPSINLQACPSLQFISSGYGSSFMSLDIGGMTNVCQLLIDNDRSITSIQASRCTLLQQLYCMSSPNLVSLGVSGCHSLTVLQLHGCGLLSLDLLDCVNLGYLNCRKCKVNVLDLSGCTKLTRVTVSASCLVTLDVSASASTLLEVKCDSCQYLEVLCAAGCHELTEIVCSDCPVLRQVDCTECSSLKYLHNHGAGKFEEEATILSLLSEVWVLKMWLLDFSAALRTCVLCCIETNRLSWHTQAVCISTLLGVNVLIPEDQPFSQH